MTNPTVYCFLLETVYMTFVVSTGIVTVQHTYIPALDDQLINWAWSDDEW